MNLYKNKNNKIIFGVCSGLAENLNIDVSLIRIALIVGIVFSGSLLFWVYLILGIILPNKEN